MRPKSGRRIFAFRKRRFFSRRNSRGKSRRPRANVIAQVQTRTRSSARTRGTPSRPDWTCLNEPPHPAFRAGRFWRLRRRRRPAHPRLIELQGFPSLYSSNSFSGLPAPGFPRPSRRNGTHPSADSTRIPISSCCARSSSAKPIRNKSSCSRSSRRSKRRESILPSPRAASGCGRFA